MWLWTHDVPGWLWSLKEFLFKVVGLISTFLSKIGKKKKKMVSVLSYLGNGDNLQIPHYKIILVYKWMLNTNNNNILSRFEGNIFAKFIC